MRINAQDIQDSKPHATYTVYHTFANRWSLSLQSYDVFKLITVFGILMIEKHSITKIYDTSCKKLELFQCKYLHKNF